MTLSLCLVTGACTGKVVPDTPAPLVRLTSGHPGAFFNPLGSALVTAFSRDLPDIRFQMVESDGALENLEMLQHGTADLGMTFADIAYLASNGRLESQRGEAFTRLRGIAVLPLTAVQVVVRKDSGLQSIAQLAGRSVAMGPRGSGTAVTAQILLEAYHVPLSLLKTEYLPFLDAASRLSQGDLDAVFVSAGFPVESVGSATQAGARLINIDGPEVDRLRNNYPFLRRAVIPAGTYPSVRAPVYTVGIDATVVCSAELDEDLVYRMTTALFDALPTLTGQFDALRRMELSRAPATPIPLHGGAARYYRERELFR